MSDQLNIALKEWAAVVAALEHGTQILLFRKGGISDEGGDFTVEERDFLLYPTYEHQKPELLKPEHRSLVERPTAPGTVRVTSWARVEKIVLASDAAQVARMFGDHVWNEDYVNMRLAYKPEKPLYVMGVRVFRLPRSLEFVETPDYAGCRSWVHLRESAALGGSVPVLPDDEFASRIGRLVVA
jgi:hypothetical protein